MIQVALSIPLAYNAGEWRISKQVVGPRGGKRWVKIISQPATGGEYRTSLAPDLYKETYWTNGWPTSSEFEVTEDGITEEEEGE